MSTYIFSSQSFGSYIIVSQQKFEKSIHNKRALSFSRVNTSTEKNYFLSLELSCPEKKIKKFERFLISFSVLFWADKIFPISGHNIYYLSMTIESRFEYDYLFY